MALTIKGAPQRVKSVGSLEQVSKDKVAAAAVRQADSRRRDSEEEKRRGSRGSRKA